MRNQGDLLLNSGSRLLNSGSRLLNSGSRLLNSGSRLLKMLLHLMDARDTTTEVLAEVIGSLKIASQIVNGDRTISKTQAEALADYFNVDISLFI
ncbi:MAG: helix-turn-helix domain-containing protein [Nostoc sp. ChiQUE01a]|nr:helix-turn-helix domain-containing protein [Nostoc sp. ChiQUE01a]